MGRLDQSAADVDGRRGPTQSTAGTGTGALAHANRVVLSRKLVHRKGLGNQLGLPVAGFA